MVWTPSLNPYLVGCLILLGFWGLTLLALRLARRSELREFWIASLACGLLGATEFLFVPEYWNPPSILKVGRADLESFLFCFAIGGVSAVLTELPRARTFFKWIDFVIFRIVRWPWSFLRARVPNVPILSYSHFEPRRNLKLENVLLVSFFLATFGTTAQFDLNIIYDAAITCVATGFFITWRRPELRWQIIGGGVTFSVVYAIVLAVMDRLYPTFYVDHWNLCALSGWWIGRAPAEEYLFAFTFGIFWAPMYEAWRGEA